MDLVVCSATGMECHLLEQKLGGRGGRLAGKEVDVLITGIGPVRAAAAIARMLERGPPSAVVVCGVGGAYPGSGLEPGDVACAARETYGDLGADSAGGFLDLAQLGFEAPELACTLFPCARRETFVTVATCSGTEARATELRRRTGGAVESMEGAAVVELCRKAGVDVGEVRGISNLAGDRDRASWILDEAALAAQRALLTWIGDDTW